LSINEIDMVRFPKQMESAGKGKWTRWTHAVVVRVMASLGVRGNGDGWSGSASRPDKYDTVVLDTDSGKWMSLAEWVRLHYEPDGTGYKKKGRIAAGGFRFRAALNHASIRAFQAPREWFGGRWRHYNDNAI